MASALVDLLRTWSTKDVCEKLETLNDLPTPLAPELEAQREVLEAEWERRPTEDRVRARAEIRASR